MKIPRHLFRFLLIATPSLAAPVAVSGPGVVTENFDSLPSGNPNWANDSTLPGWYVQFNNVDWGQPLRIADGTEATALNGLLNLGAAGSTDRALGSKTTSTGSAANGAYAVVLQNTSAKPLRLTNIAFNFELWKTNSGNTANPTIAEELSVFVTAPGAAAVTNIISGPNNATAAAGTGFTAVGTNPIVHGVSSPAATALNGNETPNSQPVSIATSILIPEGQFVTLKFTDTNKGGTDGYQGIDDLALTFIKDPECTLTATVNATSRDKGVLQDDPSDDTVDFTFTVDGTGEERSDGWVITGPPGSSLVGATGTYGTPFTSTGVPVSEFAPSLTLTAGDSVLTACTVQFTPNITKVIGTSTLSGTPLPVYTDGPADAAWIITDTDRTANMTTGNAGTNDKIASTTLIDLTATGAVQFTATFRAREVSASTNFEATDKFKAELEYTIGGVPQTPINLISAWDTGNGVSSGTDLAAVIPNGPADGYLNGYQGVDTDGTGPLLAEANYNDFRIRDEFNRGQEIADTSINNTFDLSAIIPQEADDVRLRLYGTGISNSEFFTVSNVLFAPAAADTDNDGMPDTYETANGLDPNSSGDRDLDLDGDGQSNLSEYIAGTVPNSASSVFAATITATGAAAARVDFPSVTGKSYRLHTSTTLAAGSWSQVAGPVSGTGSPLSFNVTHDGTIRYWHVSVE